MGLAATVGSGRGAQISRHRDFVGKKFGFRRTEGAKKLDTNSDFEVERVRSPSPANGEAGLRSATAKPPLGREMKRILMLSGEFNFFFLAINNTNL